MELLLEGWLELMQSLVPEKGIPKWVRYTFSIIVALLSCAVFLMFFIGVIGWISGEEIGKTLVLISVLIGAIQISFGFFIRYITLRRRGLHEPCFEARIVYADKDEDSLLTTVLCDVQKGELSKGDIVLLLNEDGFSVGIGTVHSIIRGRKEAAQIKKGYFSLSVKIRLQDAQDKPIDKAESIIKQ